MGLKKEEFTSFEIQDMDGNRLFYTDSGFDFPKMYDSNDNLIENLLMIKGRNLPEIDGNNYIYVIALKKNGDRVKYKTSVSVSSCFQMNIVLRPDMAELMQERRRYFKIKTNERAFVTFVVHSDDSTVQLEPPAEIYIKDINVGGVFFVCVNPEMKFSKGDKIMIVLGLSGSRLELMSEVLRAQPLAEPPDVGYGCRFMSITHAQEEIISRYIYKLQFEMLQKERSLRD